jgi:WD40 repeat protein
VWYSGERVEGADDDGTRLEIRTAKTGEIVRSCPGKTFQQMLWSNFTPNGRAIVGGLSGGTLRAYSVETGEELFCLPGLRAISQAHAFSTDSRVLVVGGLNEGADEFSVRVYDVALGKVLAQFDPGGAVAAVSASGDGRRVAAAVPNCHGDPSRHEVVVWDVASRSVLARVPQPHVAARVALSPDGRQLATAPQWSGDVLVYEVTSGAVRFTFRHEGRTTDLLFAPNGRELITGSKEAPIYAWDVAGALGGKPTPWDDERVWDDLGSRNAGRAFSAIRAVRANPDRAVLLLTQRTKLPPVPANVNRLITDLGADDFADREKAMAELAQAGEAVRTALAVAVPRSPSPEVRKRLTELLKRLDASGPSRWRSVRAVEALEELRTPAVTSLLEAWADGVSGAVLAAEARAALARRK